MKLLLISNSFSNKMRYLDHCIDEIRYILNGIAELLFIPYALQDQDNYYWFTRERFEKIECNIISIHLSRHPIEDIYNAKAIFVGGGNTFRLLKTLYDKNLIEPLREIITHKIPYIGSSAGANIVCPTIKTTNDMPIVYPPSFDALNLIPFHINPHYIDPNPKTKVMMETRDERIKQFHEENDSTVIGLREGSLLFIDNDTIIIKGKAGAKLFQKGKKPVEINSYSNISYLFH